MAGWMHERMRLSEDVGLATAPQVRIDAGEPSARVQVRNLQCSLTGPCDAWSRQGRPQPALISVEVWLREPFETSSATDAVTADTVHYGLLAKAVNGTLKRLERAGAEDPVAQPASPSCLSDCLGAVWEDLVDGTGDTPPFLNTTTISYLRVSIQLTKASLAGDGPTLTWAASFQRDGKLSLHARSLAIHGIRIPILIGVNANERMAKQRVIAHLDIEPMEQWADSHCEIESVLVEVSEYFFEENVPTRVSDRADECA